MNMKKIIISSILFVGFSLLTSCLKDKSLTYNTDESNSVIEFANNGSIIVQPIPDSNAAVRYALDLGSLNVGDTTTFNINVDYAGANKAPQDIVVTVDLDETLITDYNKAHAVDGADFVAPPADLLYGTTFPMKITIPKGQLMGQIKVPVQRPADYDFSLNYAYPLKITSVSSGTISGNFGTALYGIAVRNIYDGTYEAHRYILRQGDNTLSGNITYDVDMSTVGALSIQYESQEWASGGGVGGIDNTYLTIDPTTNKVTASCATNSTLKNVDGYDSHYDTQTKTIYVSYYWGGSPTYRRITDTLVYKGPRS